MLDLLSSARLADGRAVNIIRLITPEPNVSDKIKRYLMGSLSFEKYRQYYYDQAYWRLYYREALDGNTSDYVVDHIYLAEVEGEFAARVWFAYNKRSGRGNFGNVYTEDKYRQNGLMSMLLKPCVEDFHRSGARMLCCASGNKYAVASYLKVGFKLIYGGESGPLCLCDNDFASEAEKAFPGNEKLTVRPGNPGDQFDIDKFLYYTDTMLHSTRKHSVGPAAAIRDYRIAYQEMLSGAAVINVAETPSGVDAGCAYAACVFGEDVMDFNVHFAYLDNCAELLQKTAADYEAKFGRRPYLYISPLDTERLACARNAGFKDIATIGDRSIVLQ